MSGTKDTASEAARVNEKFEEAVTRIYKVESMIHVMGRVEESDAVLGHYLHSYCEVMAGILGEAGELIDDLRAKQAGGAA